MNRLALMFAAVLALANIQLTAQVLPQAATPPPIPVAVPDPNALKFDAETKEYNAQPGEVSAPFTFTVTNVSKTEVSINGLHTSCGCTVAQLPTTPYKLLPGSNVAINVTMDLRNKAGQVTKSVNMDTTVGPKSLLVKVNVPPAPAPTPVAGQPAVPAMNDRAKNIQSALADRQAVFKGDCAKCHVDKGVGKLGKELYDASCGICHDAEHRAAMVTDLKVPRSERDLAFWQKWISEGKAGTMMPAFAAAQGGPLTQEQIDSLSIYLYQNYPKKPMTAARTATLPPLPGALKK
jgi:mono/diheme cytochrome c family protein